MGWVILPDWPSQYSVLVSSSAMGCSAHHCGVTIRVVDSSASAFAPFSQNSTGLRLVSVGSGQAHPGQSTPWD